MRSSIPAISRCTLLLTFACGLSACSADTGPGIIVMCEEAAMSQLAYIGVKNPARRRPTLEIALAAFRAALDMRRNNLVMLRDKGHTLRRSDQPKE